MGRTGVTKALAEEEDARASIIVITSMAAGTACFVAAMVVDYVVADAAEWN